MLGPQVNKASEVLTGISILPLPPCLYTLAGPGCQPQVRSPAPCEPSRGFRIIGYVPMPDHFHLLIRPPEGAEPSKIM